MSHWQQSATVSAAQTAAEIPTATSGSISRSPGATHIVEVGMQEQLLFNPSQVQALVGDVVLFRFHRSNHSVTESSLQEPCVKAVGGFDSGFGHFKMQETPNDFVAFNVKNGDPRWFFCAQTLPTDHCQAGMVFGLNPGSQMNEFLDNARGRQPPTPGFAGPYGSATRTVWPTGTAGTSVVLVTVPATTSTTYSSTRGANAAASAAQTSTMIASATQTSTVVVETSVKSTNLVVEPTTLAVESDTETTIVASASSVESENMAAGSSIVDSTNTTIVPSSGSITARSSNPTAPLGSLEVNTFTGRGGHTITGQSLGFVWTIGLSLVLHTVVYLMLA